MSYEPLVTVTLGSARPGGLDISFAGLCNQTYKNWELVFVDALYHARHRRVLEYVKEIGFDRPFFHVPNYRYRTDGAGTSGSGHNTGFMLSAGEIVLVMMDYSWAYSDWIGNHVQAHANAKRAVTGSHTYYDLPAIEEANGDISIFKHLPERAEWKANATFPNGGIAQNGPIAPGAFFTKNESYPLSVLLDINGTDEYFDRWPGPGDTELSYRLVNAGCESWGIKDASLLCLNPRSLFPRTTGLADSSKTHEQGIAYAEESARTGKIRAPNPWNIRELSRKIWPWREASQSPDLVLPKYICSDEEYFND